MDQDDRGVVILLSVIAVALLLYVFTADYRAGLRSPPAAAQAAPPSAPVQRMYLRITASAATIRLGASSTSRRVVTARQDDVFTLDGREPGWYRMFVASGEYRYVSDTLAQPVATTPPLPSDPTVLQRACFADVYAQDRAQAEAEQRFPEEVAGNMDAYIDLERLLDDRYEVPVFERYHIPMAQHPALTATCAQNNWIPAR